jgi:thiosulfate dehydrogenase [quinone] large subunit
MPGALLGTEHVISFMLQHFWVLYAGVLLFSAAELMAGAMLMAGLFTRAAALVSMGFSVVLMLMFGWQGATCIDEWTMAAANLAIGTTLLLGGGGAYSLDNVLLRRRPLLAGRGWLRWAGGSLPLPQSERGFTGLALGLFAFVVVFDVSTYSYYRGSVLTAFHGGPVSPTKHHLTLDHATVAADGAVRFHVYLDGGTPEEPAHVMKAELLGADGRVLERWDGSVLAGARIRNDYLYNKFGAGPYGLVAEMGAKATIELPGSGAASGATRLLLTGVSGRSFSAGVTRD